MENKNDSGKAVLAKADELIRKARFQIIMDKRMTFFGVVLMNMKPIPVTHILSEDGQSLMDLPTAATDGRHLFYNPNFICGLTQAQVKGVVCHEVGHITGFHWDRQGARKPERFNLAGDIKINSGLRDIKIELPACAQYGDYRHTNMTVEEVYNTLQDPPPSKGGGGKLDPGGCGGFLSPRDANGKKLSASEARKVQNEMRGTIEEASRMAKAQGSMPQFVERLIQDSLHEPLNWRDILRRFVANHVRKDWTWRRPNRRLVGQGIYTPSQKVEGVGEIVIGVDSSGSITQEILAIFVREAQAIVNDVEPDRVHVIVCDATVHSFDTFEKGEPIDIKLRGGGGTAFEPVFAEVAKRGIDPLCLVFMTDGQGSYGQKPDYPVLWTLTSDYGVPWGEKVILSATTA